LGFLTASKVFYHLKDYFAMVLEHEEPPNRDGGEGSERPNRCAEAAG
jgi:hypothetical protein